MSPASNYVFRCGNCNADSELSGVGVVLVVCRFCNWSSLRSDAGLETIGKVAQVTPLASHFQIGTEGRYQGKAFTVRGQIQLDHGAGPWNEWAAEDGAGTWFWIAEAQGQVLILEEITLRDDPGKVEVLDAVKLDDGKPFLVTEIGQGLVLTSAGELPIAMQAGMTSTYADLQRGVNEIGTLDWTRGAQPEAFLGRRVELSQLELAPASQPESTPDRIQAQRLDCANCGADLTVLDPDHTLRLGCESCGTLLDVEGKSTQIVAKQKAAKGKLALPLGAEGELCGERVMVLGCMERAVKADGQWYPWREYLCRTPLGAYRWLVESNGHWMWAQPVQYSAVHRLGGRLRVDGQNFKHFTSGQAQVRWVIGEFYWRVSKGDRAETHDYVAGERMISLEHESKEVAASSATYLEPQAVAQAFGVDSLPSPTGVAPIQPNRAGAKETWFMAGLAILALLILAALVNVGRSDEAIYDQSFGPIPSPAGQELVQFSEPFELKGDLGNVQIELSAPQVNQGWIGCDGALVHMGTGAVTTFRTAAQLYSGHSGGESWSEGSRRGKVLLGSIPAGTYRMRLALTGYDKGVGQNVEIIVRRSVTNMALVILALLALLFPAVVNTIRSLRFESRRWSESDHPWGDN